MTEERSLRLPRGGGFVGSLPALGWITVLYLLSATPADGLPSLLWFAHFDKVIHAGFYAFLLSTFRPWRGWRATPGEWLPGAIVGSVVAAAGDEWHQAVVPGRSADPLDFAADVGGIALAALIWAVGERRGSLRLFRGAPAVVVRPAAGPH